MFRLLGKFTDLLASLAVVGIVGVTVLAVIMRWLLNDPLVWGEEVLIVCYIWLVMLGAASAMRKRMHVSIDAFTSMLPAKGQVFFAIIIDLVSIVALSIFGYLGYELAEIAEDKITSILGISYFYIDIAVPIGSFAMVLFCIQHLYQDIKQLMNGETLCP